MNENRPQNRPQKRRFVFTGLAVATTVAVVATTVAVSLTLWTPRPSQLAVSAGDIEISRDDFGAIIEALSEPEGYFDTDNFISNETSYLHVIGKLRKDVEPGGVYFGVGPDQNFSYIVHSQPSLAIIADIRRQNMLQHLLFKVLIEKAKGRYDFLCLLFSKECPQSDIDLALEEMLRAVGRAPAGDFEVHLREVERVLIEEYKLALSALDLDKIRYVYEAFSRQNLGLRFSSFGRSPRGYPTFERLILETDLEGRHQNYLASDELFDRLQSIQRANRLIPIVGDFAGGKALKAAATFLAERGLAVSVFYASNVEFYLFHRPEWNDYVDNVRSFPITDDAVFIRAHFPTFGGRHPQNVRGHRPTSLIQPMAGFLEDVASGQLRSYWDLVTRHLP